MIEPGKNLLKVGVEAQDRLVVDKGSDGGGGIRSDSRKFHEFFRIVREYSPVLFGDNLSSFEHISGTGIVPESLIVRKEFLIGCQAQGFDRGEILQDIVIVADNPIHLRLLEKYLREPDVVAEIFDREMKISSPREMVPTVYFGPVQE